MLFSVNLFIYVFLPLCTGIYYGVYKRLKNPRTATNLILLMFSWVFYFMGGGMTITVLLLSILASYLFARMIAVVQARGSASEKSRRILVGMAVLFHIGLLIWYKYFNFIAENVIHVMNFVKGEHVQNPFSVVLPIGISFFTFQALSYVIDVANGKVPVQKSFYKLALYISFFPQLIAGPIVRYTEVAEDIDSRKENFLDFYHGICRFIAGLSKKVLIADILAVPVDKIFILPEGELLSGLAWTGAVLFTLEIYFDFSGYSDMAIGMAQMFGFHFNENFTMPYTSRNITEFWKKWHISLSSFFRDYVYIPLGGNRKGALCTYRNLGIVFLLCGIWHGASWTFLLWGIYHGMFLILERILKNKYGFQMKGILGNLLTFLIVMFGWILFKCETVLDVSRYFRAMFGFSQIADFQFYKYSYYVNREIVFVTVLGIVLSIVPFDKIKARYLESDLKGYVSIVLLILCMVCMSDASFQAFIYFQF